MIIEEFRQKVREASAERLKSIDGGKEYGHQVRVTNADLRSDPVWRKLGERLRAALAYPEEQPDMVILYQTKNCDGSIGGVGYYFVA